MVTDKHYLGLEGRTMLITGSSRGIGAATARLANKYGADVILHGQTESGHLKELSTELEAPYIFCDVSDREAVFEKVSSLENGVDILINCAGINITSKAYEEITIDDWKKTFDVNLFGPINFIDAVLPHMKRQQYGHIVNITSIKGELSAVDASPVYAASKAALRKVTKDLGRQLIQYGIYINAVAPGFTRTEMTAATMSPRIEAQINAIPIKLPAEPEQVAETILFVASDKSGYTVGQTFIVDGGIV